MGAGMTNFLAIPGYRSYCLDPNPDKPAVWSKRISGGRGGLSDEPQTKLRVFLSKNGPYVRLRPDGITNARQVTLTRIIGLATGDAVPVNSTMRKNQLQQAKRAAASEAASGNVPINGMMEQIYAVVQPANRTHGFAMADTAWILAAIGQNREFKEWIG